MKWRWFVLLFVLLLPACRSADVSSRFSSNVPGATFAPPGIRPTTLSVAELAENPAAHAGEMVQVSGIYQRLPVLVCDSGTRPSPATWLLLADESQIGAAGYDNLLGRLLPANFEITVAGRWLRWVGPVGCGKDAPREEVWYLAVEEIVSPMPLARITATPGGVAINPTQSGQEETGATPIPTATLEIGQTGTPEGPYPAGTPGRTPTVTPSPVATQSSGAPTATSIATSTPDLAASATLTPEGAELTPSPTSGISPTTTITGTQPTVTATQTSAGTVTPSPTATETGSQVNIIDRGNVNNLPLMGLSDFPSLALALDRVSEEEAHRWQFNVQAGEVITVSAIAMPQANIRLEIRDATGNTLTSQNSAGAGSVERIAGLEVDIGGTLSIVVQESDRQATYYALLLNKSSYVTDTFYNLAGLLAYNQGQSATLPPNNDQIWVFPGEGGDTVSINLAPQGSSDLIFNLYGPTGNTLLDDYRNDSGAGQAEFLLNYTLPDDGLYAIHVGEFDFAAANYTLTVSRQ